MRVYRKLTHTDKYVDFDSRHPMQHKRSVFHTLLARADKIPPSNAGKRRERKHVFRVLADNNYPRSLVRSRKLDPKFLMSCLSVRIQPTFNNLVVLPYLKGISEKIARVLRRENVKVGYKPIKTLTHSFPRP